MPGRKIQRQESSLKININPFKPPLPQHSATTSHHNLPNSSPIISTHMNLDMTGNIGSADLSNGSSHAQPWIKPESLLSNLSPTGQLPLQGTMLDAGAAINNSLGNIYDGHVGGGGMMLPPLAGQGHGSGGGGVGDPGGLDAFGLLGNQAGGSQAGFLDPSLLHVGSSISAGHGESPICTGLFCLHIPSGYTTHIPISC